MFVSISITADVYKTENCFKECQQEINTDRQVYEYNYKGKVFSLLKDTKVFGLPVIEWHNRTGCNVQIANNV